MQYYLSLTKSSTPWLNTSINFIIEEFYVCKHVRNMHIIALNIMLGTKTIIINNNLEVNIHRYKCMVACNPHN